MKFVNLTPHTLNIKTADGIVEIPASGQVARVSVERQLIDTLSGTPVYRPKFGKIEGLPAEEDGTIFIVSGMVKSHPDVTFSRMDIASPGSPIRDTEGKIIGCDGIDLI